MEVCFPAEYMCELDAVADLKFEGSAREYNKKVAVINAASSDRFIPIRDVTNGFWVKGELHAIVKTFFILLTDFVYSCPYLDLDSKAHLKKHTSCYERWGKSLDIHELVKRFDTEREHELLLWCVQGKLDENGWIMESEYH